MDRAKQRKKSRERIHVRVRSKVRGSEGRPRLSVYKSLHHIYAQLIDDATGRTLAQASTLDKEIGKSGGANAAAAKAVGELIAKRGKNAGVKAVVFDRGGYRYHGNIKALADAARANGLEF